MEIGSFGLIWWGSVACPQNEQVSKTEAHLKNSYETWIYGGRNNYIQWKPSDRITKAISHGSVHPGNICKSTRINLTAPESPVCKKMIMKW